jgi:hypothetical protein
MKKLSDKVLALKARCPYLFNVADGASHPRSGFHIADGWFPMVERLCLLIESELINNIPEEIRGEIYLAQVKEKFGYLRFYMNQSTPYIDGAIALAEAMSGHICEICGGAGQIRLSISYRATLCDKHYESETLRRKEEYKKYLEEQELRESIKDKIEKALK